MQAFEAVQSLLGGVAGLAGACFLMAGKAAPVRLVGGGLLLIGAVSAWDALAGC